MPLKRNKRDFLFTNKNKMNENINGCLWDGHTDQDRLLTWEMIENLPELEILDQKIFEYDQSWTPHCTIYSALGACSDLLNIEITQEQIDEAVEESYNRWRTPWEWRLVKEAVSLSCDMIYKRFKIKLVYYRIPNRNDAEIKTVIEKNYSLCTWFNGNAKYQKDRRDNWRIDSDNFWTSTYGHAVCLIWREWKKFVKDNYKWRRENWYYTNIYEVVPEISKLKQNGCWQNFSYLIVKVKDEKEEDIKRLNKMKNLIDRMIEDNSTMRENTNDENYKTMLHAMNEANRIKKRDIERELSKYFN